MLGFGAIKKLFGGLARTRQELGQRLAGVLGGGRIDEERLEALEEALVAADVGVASAERVVDAVRKRAAGGGDPGAADLRAWVATELESCLAEIPLAPAAAPPDPPRVVFVVGVNGGGKTTTVAKLAARARAEGKSVLLAAADTFRAAATEQLASWGERIAVPIVRHAYGADPGAVVFDAVRAAKGRNAEILFVDTAGRLHTKSNLMQELEKMARVAGREAPGAPHEVLLVLDATTGQNGLVQAREFARAVPVTGLVITKLDGTARGGIALAIARELRIPIRYIGVGEGLDDLLDFDPRAFVQSILGSDAGSPDSPGSAP